MFVCFSVAADYPKGLSCVRSHYEISLSLVIFTELNIAFRFSGFLKTVRRCFYEIPPEIVAERVAILMNVRKALHGVAGFGGTDIKETHACVGHRELETFIVLWKG